MTDLYEIEDDDEGGDLFEAWCREHNIPPLPDPPAGIILDRAHLLRDDPPACSCEPPFIRREKS